MTRTFSFNAKSPQGAAVAHPQTVSSICHLVVLISQQTENWVLFAQHIGL